MRADKGFEGVCSRSAGLLVLFVFCFIESIRLRLFELTFFESYIDRLFLKLFFGRIFLYYIRW